MVDFATLWLNHPANLSPPIIEPCLDPHGKAVFENQCSIRMSVCLVKSGISLSSFKGAFCWFHHGKEHILRAEEQASWLNTPDADFVPSADIIKRSEVGGIHSSQFFARKGILLFRNFWGEHNQGDHIDLWNGTRMTHGTDDYFERSEEVWFWDVA